MRHGIQITLLIACLAVSAEESFAVVNIPGTFRGQPIVQPGHAARFEPAPRMEVLMMMGAGSIALLLLCRLYQHEVPSFMFVAVACSVMASIYGFLTGAWPLGIALAAYAISSFRKCLLSRRPVSRRRDPARQRVMMQPWEESRMARLFGSN